MASNMMMDFLVRRFIKDYENVENAKVRTAYGMLAGITGICCNLLLFGGKLFAGLVVNSISVMADAFNNLSDAASSIIGFVGVRMAFWCVPCWSSCGWLPTTGSLERRSIPRS